MKPVLLDTGVIVALLDRSERHHAQCAEVVTQIQAPLVTCEAVIAESCYLLKNVSGATAAVLANVQAGVFQLPLQLRDHANNVAKLMKKYASVPMDLADACLVELAGEMGTGRILTLDRDFEIYRWGKRNAFEMLIRL